VSTTGTAGQIAAHAGDRRFCAELGDGAFDVTATTVCEGDVRRLARANVDGGTIDLDPGLRLDGVFAGWQSGL
jgi:hypothetical protein